MSNESGLTQSVDPRKRFDGVEAGRTAASSVQARTWVQFLSLPSLELTLFMPLLTLFGFIFLTMVRSNLFPLLATDGKDLAGGLRPLHATLLGMVLVIELGFIGISQAQRINYQATHTVVPEDETEAQRIARGKEEFAVTRLMPGLHITKAFPLVFALFLLICKDVAPNVAANLPVGLYDYGVPVAFLAVLSLVLGAMAYQADRHVKKGDNAGAALPAHVSTAFAAGIVTVLLQFFTNWKEVPDVGLLITGILLLFAVPHVVYNLYRVCSSPVDPTGLRQRLLSRTSGEDGAAAAPRVETQGAADEEQAEAGVRPSSRASLKNKHS